MAARTRHRDQADLATLLDEGSVLRTHVLRPTWQFDFLFLGEADHGDVRGGRVSSEHRR